MSTQTQKRLDEMEPKAEFTFAHPGGNTTISQERMMSLLRKARKENWSWTFHEEWSKNGDVLFIKISNFPGYYLELGSGDTLSKSQWNRGNERNIPPGIQKKRTSESIRTTTTMMIGADEKSHFASLPTWAQISILVTMGILISAALIMLMLAFIH